MSSRAVTQCTRVLSQLSLAKTFARSIGPVALTAQAECRFSTHGSRQQSLQQTANSQADDTLVNASVAPSSSQDLDSAVVPTYEENPRWILPIPERRKRQLVSNTTGKKIKIFAPPRSARRHCPEPLKTVNEQEIAKLDPTGARTRLFSLENPEAVHVRDIVLVRQRTGEPFAGVVMAIKRAGPNTGILLRNTVAGTGVEMDFKIYSPSITGIEIVQRRTREPQQHRLYYLRDAKHDLGSVDNIVRQYLRTKTNTVAGKTVLKANPNSSNRPQRKKR